MDINQINNLIEKMQEADSKCISYQTEVKCLEKQLLASKEACESAKKNITEMNHVIDAYKSQLNAMTEHLAALNEKIVSQKDEIDKLKMTVKNKKLPKSK